MAFLGADTVDPERGLGEPTVEETHVKEVAARRARRVVLLADSSKLGAVTTPAWTRVEPGWTLLTDAAAPAAAVAAFERRGVPVLAAG